MCSLPQSYFCISWYFCKDFDFIYLSSRLPFFVITGVWEEDRVELSLSSLQVMWGLEIPYSLWILLFFSRVLSGIPVQICVLDL